MDETNDSSVEAEVSMEQEEQEEDVISVPDNEDDTPTKKSKETKPKKTKRNTGYYYYVSSSDEEADTVVDPFWRDLSEGKLDLSVTEGDEAAASGRGGRRARSAFLEASNKLQATGTVVKTPTVSPESIKPRVLRSKAKKGKADEVKTGGLEGQGQDTDAESLLSMDVRSLNDEELENATRTGVKKKGVKKSPPVKGGANKKGKAGKGKGKAKKNQKQKEEETEALVGEDASESVEPVKDQKATADEINAHIYECMETVINASDEYIQDLLSTSSVMQQHLNESITLEKVDKEPELDSTNEAEVESDEKDSDDEMPKLTRTRIRKSRQIKADSSDSEDDLQNSVVNETSMDLSAEENGGTEDKHERQSRRNSIESLSDSESKLVIADFCSSANEDDDDDDDDVKILSDEEVMPKNVEDKTKNEEIKESDATTDVIVISSQSEENNVKDSEEVGKAEKKADEEKLTPVIESLFGLRVMEELVWSKKENSESKESEFKNDDLHKAVFANDFNFVRGLLDKSYLDIDVEQRDAANGKTLSMVAAERGYDSILRSLIHLGADVNSTANDGSTPLILASEKGHQFAVNSLLYAGANVNARENTSSETALLKAIKRGHYGVVLTLVHHGVNIGMSDSRDKTALAIARLYKHQNIVDLLTSHRARLRSALLSQIEIELNRSGRVGLPVFGIQCFRLFDGPNFSISFRHELQASSANSGMLLFIGHGNVSLHQADCRLDGDCYINKVTLNGTVLKSLSEKNLFILALGPLNNGNNTVEISTVPLTKENYEVPKKGVCQCATQESCIFMSTTFLLEIVCISSSDNKAVQIVL